MVGTPNKRDISHLGLQVQIRGPDPVTGDCVENLGPVFHTVTEGLADDKHMVAVTDDEVDLAGKCVQVNWFKYQVNSTGRVTARTYCVADDEIDYED